MMKDFEKIARGMIDYIGLQVRAGSLNGADVGALARRMDADDSKRFEDVYAPNKVRELFPVNREVDPGFDTFSYRETDWVGEAAVIDDYGADLPTVEEKGEKRTHPVKTVGNAVFYSLQDMAASAILGWPVSASKPRKALMAWERKIDSLAASGDSAAGIATGLVNNASVTIVSQPTSTGVWSGRTSSLILADLNAIVKAVNVDSEENYNATEVMLPSDEYWIATQTRMGSDARSETIAQAFAAANPGVTLRQWNKLAGAGASSKDRLLAIHSSSDHAEVNIPREFTIHPPQARGLGFYVPCDGRTAGGIVHRPLAMKYMDLG